MPKRAIASHHGLDGIGGKTKNQLSHPGHAVFLEWFEGPRFHAPLTAPFALIEKMGRAKPAVGQSMAH